MTRNEDYIPVREIERPLWEIVEEAKQQVRAAFEVAAVNAEAWAAIEGMGGVARDHYDAMTDYLGDNLSPPGSEHFSFVEIANEVWTDRLTRTQRAEVVKQAAKIPVRIESPKPITVKVARLNPAAWNGEGVK